MFGRHVQPPPLPPHPCLCWDLVPSLSLNNCNYIYCRLGGKVLHVLYRHQNISPFTSHSLSFLRFSQFSQCAARCTLIYSVYSSFVPSSYSMETLLSTDALSCLNSSTTNAPMSTITTLFTSTIPPAQASWQLLQAG